MTSKQRAVIRRLKTAGGKLPWADLTFYGSRTLDSLVTRRIISLRSDAEGRHWILNQECLVNKNGKVSKKKLEAWCKSKGYPLPCYEAYGRKVCAYFFRGPEGMSRADFEQELEDVGCRTNSEWNRHPDMNGTEVENISYFKAWH
jgi:hypothetical protein